MFKLIPTNQFDRDLKRLKKRSPQNGGLVDTFLTLLKQNGSAGIERKYHPHKLSGDYKGSWKAHVKPDLLIIWFEIINDNEILLLRAGSHSDLF